jgi:hypothetical protein
MTNPEIGAWRATLDGVNRRKLNHPNKVIERWRRATQVSDTHTEPKRPSPSLSQALKDRDKVIEQLNERNKELQEEREGGGAMTIDELVAALASMLKDESPKRQVEVISDLAGRLGIGTEQKKVRRRKAKKDPFKQAEDHLNTTLGNLMKGTPEKPPKKARKVIAKMGPITFEDE